MCKLEYYGNCDEETKDNEYCIFHKPDKNVDEAKEFYEKFLKRFKHKKEKIIDERLGNEIERERLVFEGEVNCRGYVFPENTEYSPIIPEYIEFPFYRAVFKRRADFEGATFEGDAYFERATFENDAMSIRTTFKGNAWFKGTTFKGDAWFEGATFKEYADFSRATFKWDAGFVGVVFEADAMFKGVTFGGDVWFEEAIFKGDTEFIEVTFGEDADFTKKKDDEKYKFYDELSFSGAEFRKIDIDIPSEWFKLPEAEAEACGVQRISYDKEGKKDDVDRMFLRERRSLRKARIMKAKEEEKEKKKNKFQGIKSKLKKKVELIKAYASSLMEYLLADLSCEYGTNWKRPVFLWIFFVLILFPIIYGLTNGVEVNSLFDYFYFSIVTATTIGYGDLHPIGIGKVFACVEAIFGTFMWAAFIAIFARKYMR